MSLKLNPTTGKFDVVRSLGSLDSRYVNISGDTMTGDLILFDNTVHLKDYTLTIPATGTAALLGTANVFTTTQKITINNNQTTAGSGTDTLQAQNLNANNNVFSRISGLNAAGQLIGGIEIIASNQAEQTGLIRFVTFNAGTAFTGLVMSSVGRVGVGGTPSNRFHVFGGSSQRAQFDILTTISSTDNAVQLTVAGHTTQTSQVSWIYTNTTTTNNVREALRLESRVSTASTGGAAGLGVGQTFYAETATDATYQQQGLISTSWIDATNATRKAKLSLSAYDTAPRLGLEIEASGTEPMIGFYGVAPIARAVLATGAGASVDDVITALQNLGLVKQS